jgi:hypothetical protein
MEFLFGSGDIFVYAGGSQRDQRQGLIRVLAQEQKAWPCSIGYIRLRNGYNILQAIGVV